MSTEQTCHWISVERGLPPAVDAITGNSAHFIVATDEAVDGQTFAYVHHDEDDAPCWRTACSKGWSLVRVTHYRPLLELPEGARVRWRSQTPASGIAA